jgi:TolB-like protein
MKLLDELRRRNVFRVGAAYALLGWLVIQVTDTVSPALGLPEWTLSLVTWFGIIGFPFALFFAWAFELTPDGIKRESDIERGASITDSTGRKLDLVLIGLLIVAIALIAWGAINKGPDTNILAGGTATGDSAAGNQIQDPMSIAVLPLVNMSADSDNAFFAGGVHEEILTNLSRIEDLRVVSRTTAFRYLNSQMSLRDIGGELGVRYIVEGSVRRVNNHVRITVQLIDAAADAHLWASNYDRELTDVFAMQSEVAKEIANSLQLEIRPETVGTLSNMPTQSVKAYDLYMKALSIERGELESEDSLLRQRALLEAAVKEDPDYVEAWGFLNEVLDHSARNLLQNDWFGSTKEERNASFTEIREAAEHALTKAATLDADNIMTLLAQASDYVHEQQDPAFQVGRKTYIDRAIEIEPDNAVAWLVLGWWHRLAGDNESATSAFRKALELDPLHARNVFSALTHFRLAGDQETTTELFARLAQIAPERANDETLREISPVAKLNNLFVLFTRNADESVIQSYADELARLQARLLGNAVDQVDFELEVAFQAHRLAEMRDDWKFLLDTGSRTLPPDANDSQVIRFLWGQAMYIRVMQAAGLTDRAIQAAKRMIDFHGDRVDQNSHVAERAKYPMSTAHLLLGNDDAIRELRESLLASEDDVVIGRDLGTFLTLSNLEPDDAVRRLLDRKAKYPNWFLTDWLAALHISNRAMLLRPEMQSFYVQEGKWIDYLAARIPEYAKYKK